MCVCVSAYACVHGFVCVCSYMCTYVCGKGGGGESVGEIREWGPVHLWVNVFVNS